MDYLDDRHSSLKRGPLLDADCIRECVLAEVYAFSQRLKLVAFHRPYLTDDRRLVS